MKRLSFIILISTMFLHQICAQSITAVEYFFDDDPGLGMANVLAVNSNSGDLNQSYNISMASVDEGLHLLTIRVKDNEGRWSLNDKKWIYVSKTNAVSNIDIIEAEYFIDTDIGFGNNNALNIPTEANPTVTTSISVAGLASGIHIFYARVKNADNKWSLYHRQLIYISELAVDSNIVAFQYYIDSETNGVTAIPIDPSETSPNRTFNINTMGLAEGDHLFCIRTKNENNSWSLYDCEVFTIDSSLGIIDSLYKAVKINPNPFLSTINLDVSKSVMFQRISVFDITGKEVYTTSNDLRKIGLSNLESGTYILSLLTETEKATFKIVKQ